MDAAHVDTVPQRARSTGLPAEHSEEMIDVFGGTRRAKRNSVGVKKVTLMRGRAKQYDLVVHDVTEHLTVRPPLEAPRVGIGAVGTRGGSIGW